MQVVQGAQGRRGETTWHDQVEGGQYTHMMGLQVEEDEGGGEDGGEGELHAN